LNLVQSQLASESSAIAAVVARAAKYLHSPFCETAAKVRCNRLKTGGCGSVHQLK
jgi:hypothetical protein